MQLILVAPWFDSGGGYMTRLLDSELFHVWPYEFLMGDDNRPSDNLTPNIVFGRYRWPNFSNRSFTKFDKNDFVSLFSNKEFFDLKFRKNTKHNYYQDEVDFDAWYGNFRDKIKLNTEYTRKTLVTLYVETYFSCLNEVINKPVLVHCPAALLDMDLILSDYPNTKFINVIRHPELIYRDFCYRHKGVSRFSQLNKWIFYNSFINSTNRLEGNILQIKLQDILSNPAYALKKINDSLGLFLTIDNFVPTWSGQNIDFSENQPFGGVKKINDELEVLYKLEKNDTLESKAYQYFGKFCA